MGIKTPGLRLVVVCAVSVVLSYAVLLNQPPLWLASFATVILTVAVPGALFAWLLLEHSESPPTPLEWIVYAAACGFGILRSSRTCTGLTRPRACAVAGTDGSRTPLALSGAARLATSPVAGDAAPAFFEDGKLTRRQWLTVGAAILVVGMAAGYLRFANIGFAEFHGDEARAVLRVAAVIQGDDQVLFVHRKPPGEILLPAVVFAYAGHINEAVARIPLAMANMVALLGILLLGWRMRSQVMGWTAVVFCALDGYLVAFSRFLQYQSVVLLLTVVVVLVFHRAHRNPVVLRRYALAGALPRNCGALPLGRIAGVCPGCHLCGRNADRAPGGLGTFLAQRSRPHSLRV